VAVVVTPAVVMPQSELERTVQWSVLDRLIDTEPTSTVEAPLTWAQSVRELKRGVRRDLEWLLNTRRIVELAPEGFVELPSSLYHYGLPDITSLPAASAAAQEWLRRQVEEAITLFEPRLSGVRVAVATSEEEGRRELRFIIDGLLHMEPSPEQVVFDTVLEITSSTFEVKGERDA
jgi:type VI secretion system protein ImpF